MKKKYFMTEAANFVEMKFNSTQKKLQKINLNGLTLLKTKKKLNVLEFLKELLSKLHIIKSDGTIYTGIEAFREIWREIKFLKFLDFLLKFKLFHLIASFAYKIWLKTR